MQRLACTSAFAALGIFGGCGGSDPKPWIDALEADCERPYAPEGYKLVGISPATDLEREPEPNDVKRVNVFLTPDGTRVGRPDAEPLPYAQIGPVFDSLESVAGRIGEELASDIRDLDYFVHVDENVKVGDLGLVLATIQAVANPEALVMVGRRRKSPKLEFPKPELAAKLYAMPQKGRSIAVADQVKKEIEACPPLVETLAAVSFADTQQRCGPVVQGLRAAAAQCRASVDWQTLTTLMLYSGRPSQAGHLTVPRRVLLDWLVPADIDPNATWGAAGPSWLGGESDQVRGRLPVTAGGRTAQAVANGLISAAGQHSEDLPGHAVACALGALASCNSPGLGLGRRVGPEFTARACRAGESGACLPWIFELEETKPSTKQRRRAVDDALATTQKACHAGKPEACRDLASIATMLIRNWPDEPEIVDAYVDLLEPGLRTRCEAHDQLSACWWLWFIYGEHGKRPNKKRRAATRKKICRTDPNPDRCPT